MGKKLAYERYYWFHGQIKGCRYPNARKLAESFEVSEKQAQRDIEFIRDRLGAPLVYHSQEKGYIYEDPHFELPPVWLKEEELFALCLALRFTAVMPDRRLKDSLDKAFEKFLAFRFVNPPPGLDEVRKKVSIKNVVYSKVDENIFHPVLYALFQEETLKINYFSPHKNESTERVIRPLHLFCYLGNWHLIAFCRLKKALRDFALSRVRTIEKVVPELPLPEYLPPIKEYLDRNFGVMSGKESMEVCLRFSPQVANWVSEQIWHNDQKVYYTSDGSLCLQFPVANFKEVRREILKYGAGVEVLFPLELREEVKREIGKMAQVYL
ncbi:MAG: YafY family transcriptional regulator [Deltaproteobacteria bacterium]|nr:YafY family transcriptional regulator [Deltaproteobacteria bacterium]